VGNKNARQKIVDQTFDGCPILFRVLCGKGGGNENVKTENRRPDVNEGGPSFSAFFAERVGNENAQVDLHIKKGHESKPTAFVWNSI
jgi:hypothetical protein